MKILVSIPSNMKFGPNGTNGLVLAARECSLVLHKRHNVDVSVIAQITEEESWYTPINKDYTGIRQHQVRLFKDIVEEVARAEAAGTPYDLLHLHSNFYQAAIAGHKLSKQINIPIIVTHHSPFFGGTTANALSGVIVDAFKSVYLNYPGNFVHYQILRNYKLPDDAIPFDIISNVPCEFPFVDTPKEKIVAIVSRIDQMKNPVHNLNTAIRDARKHGYKVVFVGDTNIIVESKASKNCLEQTLKVINDNLDIVEHHTHMSRDEVSDLLRRAVLLYQFSNTENQALAPIEANASGCAVAGYTEVLPHVDSDEKWNPLVSRTTKWKEFCEIDFLELALKHTPQQYRNFFEQRFPRDGITDLWYNYYQRVVATGKPNAGQTQAQEAIS